MPERDRSGQSCQPFWHVAAAAEACSRLVGVCRDLSPFLPLPSPFFSLCLFGVCLNVTLRFTPLRGMSLDACA